MISTPSFEFCALRFLAQWQERECALHKALSSTPTEDDIREALSYFQVARTFTGLNTSGRATVIRKSLREVCKSKTLLTPIEKVDRLTGKFKKHFNRFNLSAASKLLWLSERAPIIVYDARSVNALTRDFSHRFSDYQGYWNAWREEYAQNADKIQAAVKRLPKGRMFMRSCSLSDQKLVCMAKKTWFMERVFDVYLWEVGVKK